MMKWRTATVVAAGSLLLPVLVGIAPANAASGGGSAAVATRTTSAVPATNPPVAPEIAAAPSDTVTTSTRTNADCVAQIQSAISHGATNLSTKVCTRTVTLRVSAPQRVTSADLAIQSPQLTGTDYQALAAAVTNSTAVQSRYFSYTQPNGTDSETQYGVVYYNGSNVWISYYLGYTGYHVCKVDYSVGYTVELRGCFDWGTTSLRRIVMHWHFTAWGPFPVNWDESHTVYANSTGSIWW